MLSPVLNKRHLYDDEQVRENRIGLAGAVILGAAVVGFDRVKGHLLDGAVKLGKSRLYGGVVVPIKLYNLAWYAKLFTQVSKEEKTDVGLMMSTEISSLIYNTASFMMGLKELKYLGEGVINYSSGLIILSVPMQMGRLMLTIRGTMQTRQLLKELDLEKGADFEKVRKMINQRDDFFISKQFRVSNPEGFRKKINQPFVDQSKVMRTLKERLVTKKLSDRLCVAAITVTFVASVMFLVSPLSPIGNLLFILGATLEGVNVAYELRNEKHLLEGMGMSLDNNLVFKMARCAQKQFSALNHKLLQAGNWAYRKIKGKDRIIERLIKQGAFKYA